ncbi:unnamed protein product [Rotaria sordida]|uniref:ANK_REP_REGION domain-containing protein n=2 Tax=Rotaria sordida TaxID=392033 RepID=A0A816C3K7_9BILA|nr:unnamed protein product [Rotaria sordida]CAF1615400.1 unnamed protein product [Rotaria sordida]
MVADQDDLINAASGWQDRIVPFGKRAENNKIAGSTPLTDATKYNHSECVKRLLVHHANPNHKNHSSISALILAAKLGYFECVKLLVQARADLKLSSSSSVALRLNLCGQTSLFCAAREDRTDIVKYLLDDEANRHVRNHYGVSALCIPLQKGILQVVELLLNDGTTTHVAPFDSQADELNITGF